MVFQRFLLPSGDCCVRQLRLLSLALAYGVAGDASQSRCESFSGAMVPHGGKPRGRVARTNTVKATWVHWSQHGEKRISMVCKPAVRKDEQQSSHEPFACATHAVSEESFRSRAARTFQMFVSEDGKLSFGDVLAAVQIHSIGRMDEGMPLVLGPLLWRLMGKGEHDGGATLEEFMHGQELLTIARSGNLQSDRPTKDAIEELCWRALTANRGDVPIGRAELSVMIRRMLHLDALDSAAWEEINRTWVAKKVRMHKTGCGYYTTFPQEAIEYYMRMYDLDGDGVISRDDFSKCSSLQHNFWLLLTKPELDPISLVRGLGDRGSARSFI